MRIKELVKKTVITFMAAAMLTTGVMAVSSTKVHASEKVENGKETIYKNLLAPEKKDLLDELNFNGKVTKIDDHTYKVVKNDNETFQYSVIDRTVSLKKYYQKFESFENRFTYYPDAQDAIKNLNLQNATIEKEYISLFPLNFNFYIKGELPVSTITVKEMDNATCTSLKLQAPAADAGVYVKPGEITEVRVAEMNGGTYDDLEWTCSDERVSLSPYGAVCYVTASEAVGAFTVRATVSNNQNVSSAVGLTIF